MSYFFYFCRPYQQRNKKLISLAGAIAEAEDELICDFAECYHIYDYQALPLQTAAVLFSGLGEDSRTIQKLSGFSYDTKTYLLAAIADRLSLLVWFQTKDGQKGRNRPASFVEQLNGTKDKEEYEIKSFRSAEELDAALAEFERR